MNLQTKRIGLALLDWTRKLFFACIFATLVSFWSAKWEEAQEKNPPKSCECRLLVVEQMKSYGEKR